MIDTIACIAWPTKSLHLQVIQNHKVFCHVHVYHYNVYHCSRLCNIGHSSDIALHLLSTSVLIKAVIVQSHAFETNSDSLSM